MHIHPLQSSLRAKQNKIQAKQLARFFKTGVGEYAHGDIFLGIKVPVTRSIVKTHIETLTLQDIETILKSPYHEERLAALIALTQLLHHRKSSTEKAARLYLKHTQNINNWDLVDISASHIIGPYVEKQETTLLLEKLATSKSLWERRIAIIATFYFIMKGKGEETLKIATLLLRDDHDLIHKAVGWMLREVGKRVSEEILTSYLDQHLSIIRPTTLRYAIERLSPDRRKMYLEKRRSSCV